MHQSNIAVSKSPPKRLTKQPPNVCKVAKKLILTEATSTPWLCAMCPRIEKVTVPASKHVAVFTMQVITVSLVEEIGFISQHFF